jgi:hypothetical protein
MPRMPVAHLLPAQRQVHRPPVQQPLRASPLFVGSSSPSSLACLLIGFAAPRRWNAQLRRSSCNSVQHFSTRSTNKTTASWADSILKMHSQPTRPACLLTHVLALVCLLHLPHLASWGHDPSVLSFWLSTHEQGELLSLLPSILVRGQIWTRSLWLLHSLTSHPSMKIWQHQQLPPMHTRHVLLRLVN